MARQTFLVYVFQCAATQLDVASSSAISVTRRLVWFWNGKSGCDGSLWSVILIFKVIQRNWTSLVAASGQSEWLTHFRSAHTHIHTHIRRTHTCVFIHARTFLGSLSSSAVIHTSVRQKTSKKTFDGMLLIIRFHIPHQNTEQTTHTLCLLRPNSTKQASRLECRL